MAVRGIGESERRDQLTIMSDLLEIIQQRQRLTHILYKSNMSYSSLVKYMENMTELGLIEQNQKPFRTFGITEKGKQFLEMLAKPTQPNSNQKRKVKLEA